MRTDHSASTRTAILLLAAAGVLAAPWPGTLALTPGDVTGDGTVDTADMGCVTSTLFGATDCAGHIASLPRTGQVSCRDEDGGWVACADTGQDGDLLRGLALPQPRFVNNLDGTVSDELTGLVWLRRASCDTLPFTDAFGRANWDDGHAAVATLAHGACSLTDGSVAGDWRLPNDRELLSLAHYEYLSLAVSNAAGTGPWTDYDPFIGIQTSGYRTSTTDRNLTGNMLYVTFSGATSLTVAKTQPLFLWPVREPAQGLAKRPADVNGDGSADAGDLACLMATIDDAGCGCPALLPRAPVPQTGQATCWNAAGSIVDCGGTGHDGDHRAGVPLPVPRFAENDDGTVTDVLTGLVWLEDATCTTLAGTDGEGKGSWQTGLDATAALAHGTCGLADGSSAGDWRLPNVRELYSLVHHEYATPPLSNALGTGQWSHDYAFVGVDNGYYWTSDTYLGADSYAFYVNFYDGKVHVFDKAQEHFIWPVRDGSQ